MHQVLAYIDEHLDQPLDLGTLADVACFSSLHFHRLFAAGRTAAGDLPGTAGQRAPAAARGGDGYPRGELSKKHLWPPTFGRSGFAHNHAFEMPLVENIQQHHTLLFCREPGGNLHGNPEHAVFLRGEQIPFKQRLVDASPLRSGNSQHLSLCFEAVVDPLRLLCGPRGRSLIIERNKPMVELGWEEIGDGIGTSLYPRPASLLLAPLGNVGNALRRSDDVVTHNPRHDSDGSFEPGIDLLCIPDAQKVDALLPALRDVAEHRQCVGHDVGAVSTVVPGLSRNDALRGTEDQAACDGPLEIELVERVG